MSVLDSLRLRRRGRGEQSVPQARISPTTTVPAAPSDAPRASTRELGYAVTSGSWWSALSLEAAPDLLWPESILTYSRMRRSDAQIASVLRAVKLPVRRTRWQLDPAGADEVVVRLVAEDLGLPVRGWGEAADAAVMPLRAKDRFSWAEHLTEALLMLDYGHSMFEQVYRIDEQGRARLRKLALRPSVTLSKIEVAPDGGLVGIRQERLSGDDTQRDLIPTSRLVAYCHEREGGDWRGQSLLRPVYKNWLLKDRALRVGMETLERNGMGVPTYTGAEDEKNLDEGRKLAQAYRASAAGGAAIPYGAKLDLRGVDGRLPDPMPTIEYHDAQIARAVLAHFLNLGGDGGSYALAAVQSDTFTQSLQALAQQVADVAGQHVIEDLVDVNFGPGARAPQLVFEEIGSRQAATAQAVQLLVTSGVLTNDDALEQAVRSNLGLPEKAPGARARPLPSTTVPPPVPVAPETTTGD